MAKDFESSEKTRMNLEEMFFAKEDKKLIEKLKTIEKMEATKKALKEVSGIHNEKILEKLVDLKIEPETVAALSLVPLVEIAWADEKIDEKERQAVMKAAGETGVKEGSIEHDLLAQWMKQRPPAKMLEAWKQYTQGLCEKLTPEEIDLLKKDIMGQVKAVAEASGGLLGLGSKISKVEKAMMEKLESAFK